MATKKEYSVEFARNERNAYTGTIKAGSIKKAIAEIKAKGVEALKDYEEDAVIDVLNDDSFAIVGEWKPSGGGSSSLHRFEEEIKIEEPEIGELKKVVKVYNVEELFDIDKEDNDDEVIKVADLTEEQKKYLGLTE